MSDDFRCSTSSLLDDEPMAGTAPTDRAWLFIEYAGAWGHKAVAESRMPDRVHARLAELDGVRVQLIRRHGRSAGPGVRVFVAWLDGSRTWVETTVLEDFDGLVELDLAGLAEGARPGLTPYDDPLWMVCTNGRRDRCCTEIGRPIAAALSARWPSETWETTHLGGHRFSGTLLALPSGLCPGRLDAISAVEACAAIEAGGSPLDALRGRAGRPPAAQVAELAAARQLDVPLARVRVEEVVEDAGPTRVHGRAEEISWQAAVVVEAGQERRASCADLKLKAVQVHRVVDLRTG